jgi:uncharacterized protein (TIGR02996 family)
MESAFLRAITDDPDDLVSRRVFADWLSEQPDAASREWAEFMQLQFTLAADQVQAEERQRLVTRQRELLERHRQAWEEPFKGLVRSCEYRNGFAERVTLDGEHFIAGFADLIQRTPVVRVRLHGLTLATAADVAAAPALAHVRELDLQHEWITAPVLGVLLRSPHLTRLRYLNLSRNELRDEGIQTLIASSVFGQLRYLNLSHVGLTFAGVRSLVNSLAARSQLALQWLTLRGAPSERTPGDYPPLPSTLPLRLRQSVQGVLGQRSPAPRVIEELYPARATLPEDLRRWVEWLYGEKRQYLAQGLKLRPLPAEVHRALAAVCMRRAVWRADRTKAPLPAFPVDVETSAEALATAVNLLTRMADAKKEEAALADCLLDLYLRHQRGELPADGRTR